ncbi:MAG TPA: hypothetical protein VFW23_06205 [Tepidisphaeraceae bacterium]|nr:hypothetical protein [Tepidisphaeraceae bacterium]
MRASRSNIATAISMILFIALLAIAARTYFARDVLGVQRDPYRAFWIEFPRGSIQFTSRSSTRAEDHRTGWKVLPPSNPSGVQTVLGFGLFHNPRLFIRDRSGTRWIGVTLLVMPIWPWVALAALLPAAWLRRKLMRVRPDSCPNCGYDLRATPSRCPECGAISPS